jgi:dihydropteroate synthase
MSAAKEWKTASGSLSLERPLVMGVVNVTPDSFSDGGRWSTKEKAVEHALQLVREGADILDIGGESTRPGAAPVSLSEELDRVIGVIEALKGCGAALSVDTVKAEVMREAARAGADILNDINGFRAPGAEDAAVETGCGLCIMHMQGEPRTMQIKPMYTDFFEEVKTFLLERARLFETRGVEPSKICLDPGFGFGKTVGQNFELLARTGEFVASGYPVLYGMSRKSSLGAVTGISQPDRRVTASVVAHVLAAEKGAQILRVHDVAETVAGLRILESTENFAQIP